MGAAPGPRAAPAARPRVLAMGSAGSTSTAASWASARCWRCSRPSATASSTQKMVRDLITPKRFAVGGGYRDSEVVITSGFRIRHLGSRRQRKRNARTGTGATNGHPVASVFEPVQLLVGDDWLLSCWHPPRVFRGLSDPVHVADDSSSGLYLAVAKRWPTSNADGRRGPRQARAPRARRRRRLPAANQLTPMRARPVRSAGGPHGSPRPQRRERSGAVAQWTAH